MRRTGEREFDVFGFLSARGQGRRAGSPADRPQSARPIPNYVGQSGTVVRDTTISPEKAGNATGEIKAGHRAAAMRLVTAIVDEPGQRP